MQIMMKENLAGFISRQGIDSGNVQLPDVKLAAGSIKVMMINEVPPNNPDDYFYSKSENPDYMRTTLSLFQEAGVDVKSMEDIIARGIYITTAVKSPKQQYAVENEKIIEHLPILEHEMALFLNLQVVMLMGDVAKKAFNMIAKKHSKKNAVPSGATYRIRHQEFYYGGLRVFPSYIMTGGNLLIEKSKRAMICDDIRRMMEYTGVK